MIPAADKIRSAVAPALLAYALGCAAPPTPPSPAPNGPATITLTDVTGESGIAFIHDSGASPRRYLPETMGAGLALFDADGDGLADVYFANGGAIEGRPSAGAFYRNLGGMRFREATAEAGLDAAFYGMGIAVGDVDSDGDLDLFVSGVAVDGRGGDHLFRNRGDGRFDDVTDDAGLGVSPGFGSSAAFFDADRDGDLDLYVGRYVAWSRASDVRCSLDGKNPTYCTPEAYSGAASRFYRNRGDGRFDDATAAAGLERPDGKALGVAVLDHDGDGWDDLAIANDTARNFLFVNRRDGTFEEVAVEAGFAFSLSGATRGAMGIDAADLDGDGVTDVVVGNFSQEMSAIYRGSAARLYADEAAELGVGLPSLMPLAFGTLAVDLDGDGWLDLAFANGHIEPDIARFQRLQAHAQRPLVFRNLGGDAGFTAVEAATGPLAAGYVGRGLAAADLDADGDLDLVLTQNGGPAVVLRNDAAPGAFVRLRARDARGNGSPYGLAVEVETGGRTLRRSLASGRSYLSASEVAVSLRLPAPVTAVRLRWPSGTVQDVDATAGDLGVVPEPATPSTP